MPERMYNFNLFSMFMINRVSVILLLNRQNVKNGLIKNLLKQVDAAVFAVCNHFFGPEGYLNLTNVSFFKYKHAQP